VDVGHAEDTHSFLREQDKIIWAGEPAPYSVVARINNELTSLSQLQQTCSALAEVRYGDPGAPTCCSMRADQAPTRRRWPVPSPWWAPPKRARA
jgi:hypothetical protein